jgi:hypothetical protein
MISIPYLGKIMLRPSKEDDKTFDQFLLLTDNFKTILHNVKNGDETGLIQFFQENFINRVIDNIVESDDA